MSSVNLSYVVCSGPIEISLSAAANSRGRDGVGKHVAQLFDDGFGRIGAHKQHKPAFFGQVGKTLLIDKGITVTTSLLYAFIIAIANPIGPLLGFLVADRMERKWQIVWSGIGIGVFMLLFALQSNQAIIIGSAFW